MTEPGNASGGDKPGALSTPPTHVWVPVLVAAISATSAIGAAVIMRPPTPAPPASQGIVEVASVAGPDASSATRTSAQTAAPPRPTSQAANYREQVLVYLDRQHKPLTDAGFRRDAGVMDWMGLLQVGTPKVWEVHLVRGGEYQIVGVCDSDCKDLDMEIYDASGRLVGADTLVDDYPRVPFRPAQSGPHTVKVWLRDCNVADGSQACVVAVRVLRR